MLKKGRVGEEGNHEPEEEGVVPVGRPEVLDGRKLFICLPVVVMHFALIENDLVCLNRGRLERFELSLNAVALVEREENTHTYQYRIQTPLSTP